MYNALRLHNAKLFCRTTRKAVRGIRVVRGDDAAAQIEALRLVHQLFVSAIRMENRVRVK